MKLISDKKIKCNQPNHLKLQIINDKLVVSPCCHLGYIVLDEINNLDEIDNLYEYLNNIYNNNKKNKFDINQYSGCYSENNKCYLSTGKLKCIDISISQSCNLNCIHCNYKKTNKYDDLYFKVLNKLTENESNLEQIYLTSNGEPFLYYDKILDFLKKINNNITKKIVACTNGTLLNKKRIDELYNISKETGVKYDISVSIDSFTKETFKKIRNFDLDKIIENTLYLKEKNLLKRIQYCVMLENLHEFNLLDKFCKENKIEYYYGIVQSEDEKKSKYIKKELEKYKK